MKMDNSELYEKSILLIGPSGMGKTTISEELSKKTGMGVVHLDRIANEERRMGIRGRFASNDEYKLYLFNRLIDNAKRNNSCGIVDFGAGHSIFESEEKFMEAKELLGNFQNIILLQYSDDIEESLEVINARSTGDTRDNFRFLTSECNTELATITIYTKEKTKEEIADEIIEKIKSKDKLK